MSLLNLPLCLHFLEMQHLEDKNTVNTIFFMSLNHVYWCDLAVLLCLITGLSSLDLFICCRGDGKNVENNSYEGDARGLPLWFE